MKFALEIVWDRGKDIGYFLSWKSFLGENAEFCMESQSFLKGYKTNDNYSKALIKVYVTNGIVIIKFTLHIILTLK